MINMTNELPKAPLERILRKSGAERVSEGAIEEFRDQIEVIAREKGSEAAKWTEHANRKTVQAGDIKNVFN